MALEIDTAFSYLSNSLSKKRLSHAYLITGEKGSGKDELVLKLVALINSQSQDNSLQDVISPKQNSAKASVCLILLVKSFASVVHPGVLSLG